MIANSSARNGAATSANSTAAAPFCARAKRRKKWGPRGRPGCAAECATQHAVRGLVTCAAQELVQRGIPFTTIYPVWVNRRIARAPPARRARDEKCELSEVLAEIEAGTTKGRMVGAD